MRELTAARQIALEAIELWQGEPASLQLVSDSENYVFSFTASKKKRFLRLTSSHHRPRLQIEAELDFICYLHCGGISVSLPLTSLHGLSIEELQVAPHTFFACVFKEAEGESFKFDSREANIKHFRLLGQTLHALARKYRSSANARRLAWDEDDCILNAERSCPSPKAS